MTEIPKPTLLVTGASGHLGGRVAELLLESGAGRVVAGSRDPAKIARLRAKGAEVRKVDFEDAASLDAAFTGVDRLLIVSTDALGVPGKRLEQHRAAVVAAERAGVKHVVYTSMPKPEPGSPLPIAPDHYGTEQALAAAAFSWTVLRNSWYMENLFMTLPQVLASGKWYSAAGDGRIAYVAREDCARAAAAALASSAAEDRVYDITGPEALTTAEIASVASHATGRPIEVVPVSDEDLAKGLAAAGLPPFVVELIAGFDAAVRRGDFAPASGAVEELTHKRPEALDVFFAEQRDAFRVSA